MSGRLRVLVIGGYGTFGGRLVDLLERDSRLTLIVAGRSLARAATYCARQRPDGAELVPAAFDRNGELATQLADFKPDIVVDASGPFQAYGEQPYRLVEACIRARTNYLDLADGSEFVAGVKRFDAAARAAGVYVLAGVSSFPVLTAAVVRRLCVDMASVTSIRGGIAPSPFAGVGINVVRAIASYAGQPVRLKRAGAETTAYPFTESVRYTIAPPGRVPLKRTLFSLVDVPDLRVLAELWPQARTIWMGAGPVPEVLHRALIAFAWLARWRVVRSLSPLAPLMSFVMGKVRWGEHRGGMFVEVDGVRPDGTPSTRSWHLLAEGDDGPLIPSMALQAVIERALDGRPPPPGARSAARDLELDDYAALFAGRTIFDAFATRTPRAAHRCMPACSGRPGPDCRRRSARCTTSGRRRCSKASAPWSADARCSRVASPRSSAFRARAWTSTSRSGSTSRTASSDGPGRSRAGRSRATS